MISINSLHVHEIFIIYVDSLHHCFPRDQLRGSENKAPHVIHGVSRPYPFLPALFVFPKTIRLKLGLMRFNKYVLVS